MGDKTQRDVLEDAITDKGLVDLHCHLLGCGRHEFWIGELTRMAGWSQPDQKDPPAPEIYATAVEFEAPPAGGDNTDRALQERLSMIKQCIESEESVVAQEPFHHNNFAEESVVAPEPFHHNNFEPALLAGEVESLENSLKNALDDVNSADRGRWQGDSSLSTKSLRDQMGKRSLKYSRYLIISEKQFQESSIACAFIMKDYAVFDARLQKFNYIKGFEVTKEVLDYLKRSHGPALENAFTAAPHPPDLRFTPEFCPRRFALKDALYARDLSVLDRLLEVICNKYMDNGVRYVEFSVGYKDLVLRPWVFKHLTSFPNNKDVRHNKDSSANEPFRYNYLAAFNRGVKTTLYSTQTEAIRYLLGEHNFESDEIYEPFESALDSMSLAYERECAAADAAVAAADAAVAAAAAAGHLLSDRVRGLDLVGDEYGYPYVPFWRPRFWDFIQERMRAPLENKVFGIRPHMGEVTTKGYRQFLDCEKADQAYKKHVEIMKRALNRLMPPRIGYIPGLRLGHGFAICLNYALQQMFKKNKIDAIELCYTSNQRLLRGDFLVHPVAEYASRFVICTDDDGILPTDCGCDANHTLVAGEICRLITGGQFDNPAIPNDPRPLQRAIAAANCDGFTYRTTYRNHLQQRRISACRLPSPAAASNPIQ